MQPYSHNYCLTEGIKMNKGEKTPQADKAPAAKKATPKWKVVLGVIVAIFLVIGIVNHESGLDGDWVKSQGLPRGYDHVGVNINGSRVITIIQIGPAILIHSGEILPKKSEEEGGKKLTMLATVKVTSKGVNGLEDRVLNDALDVLITFHRGEKSYDDTIDYFIKGEKTDPVSFDGLHRK